MQRLAFAHQQVGVNGLSGEGVPKDKVIGIGLADQLGGDELFDERQQFALVVLGDGLQEREVEALPGHGCGNQHRAGRFAQLGGAPLHGILHRARDAQRAERLARPDTALLINIARTHQRFERLFDKERIAIGQRLDRAQKFVANLLLVKDGANHFASFGGCQAF